MMMMIINKTKSAKEEEEEDDDTLHPNPNIRSKQLEARELKRKLLAFQRDHPKPRSLQLEYTYTTMVVKYNALLKDIKNLINQTPM